MMNRSNNTVATAPRGARSARPARCGTRLSGPCASRIIRPLRRFGPRALGASLLLSLLFVHTGAAQSGIERVWAVDDGEKVKRDDLTHWASTSSDNPVWDGNQVRIAGARNEIVAFQLILESTSAGASQVDVELDALQGPSYVIRNSSQSGDPFDYVGKHIELFLEHYVNITFRSYSGGVSTWGGARPLPDEEHLGWIPDALVPFEAVPGTADWVGGAPFEIGPRRNQGVWVDIYIPREAPPGTYTGTVRVLESGQVTAQVPLSLQVYSFTLSDSTHFRNFVHIDPVLLERHPGVQLNTQESYALFHKYMKLFHRHRMDLTDGRRPLESFRTYLAGYYTGESYTQAEGYDGPGLGVGNGTYSIGTYDQFDQGSRSGFYPATQEGWWAAADAWEEWFTENAPEVERFKYMRDEPDFQSDTAYAYAEIRRRAEWLHSNPGIGRALRAFCTVKIDPRLYGAVDFWSLTSQSGYDPGDGVPQGYMVELANERRALGEKVGFYNGTRPAYGLLEWIDNFATDARVDPWIAWKYNVDQYFLWEMAFVYNKWYDEKLNPWLTPYSGKTLATSRWGIGTIIYTGNDALFPQENRGIDGPIASIRLKNWRRGQQDYEYLALAQKAGIDTRAIVDSVVPAAFDDYNGTTYTRQGGQPIWAQRGYLFERARTELAAELEGAPKTELPTGSFTITPDTLPPGGGTATLQWSSSNATSASIDQGIGTVPLQGSRQVTVSNSKTFRLTLANQGGSITLTAGVTVAGAATPSGTFDLSPRELGEGGGNITLTWTSANATAASIDNGIGPVPLAGSRTVPVAASTVFTLTLTDGSTTVNLRDSVRVHTPPPTPTGTFAASPVMLGAGGGDVTLSWSSQGAASATIDQGIGPVELAGNRTVTVTEPTTFTLLLSNGIVTTLLQATVEIDTTPPRPTGTFTATPSSLPYGGGEALLIWSSSNATSAVIDQGIGPVTPNGSRTVQLTSDRTFTLVLSNAAHAETLSVKIRVSTSESLLRGSFDVAPPTLPAGGGEIVLSWTSENATAASLDHGIGNVSLSGTRAVTVDQSSTFNLTLSNATDTLVLSRDIVVEESLGAPSAVLAVLPSILPEGGGEVTLFWSTEKAARVTIDNGLGPVPINGSSRLYIGSSSTFTLTAENAAGTVRSAAAVLVGSSTIRGVPSLAQNPGFEIGTTHWNFQSDGVGRLSAEQSTFTGGKAARIDIQDPGTVVQFYQAGITLEPQTRYRLEFDAWASSGHDLDVFLHQHYAPFASYGLTARHLDVQETTKTFSLEFVTENFTTPVSDSRLRFWFGPYANQNDVYWIDNVLLQKIAGPVVTLAAPTVAFEATASPLFPATFAICWERIPEATHYHLQVSRDSLFRVIEYEDSSLVDTVTDIGPFTPGTRHFLRLRADASAVEGPYSPIYAFMTQASSSLPLDFMVEQNYPNPFNAGTVIRYSLRAATHVQLKVYDLLGREVITLVDADQAAGAYRVSLSSNTLASATYFYVFQAGDYREVRKMILLR